MKSNNRLTIIIFLGLSGLGWLGGCQSTPTDIGPVDNRVTVTYQNPEKFIDMADRRLFGQGSSPGYQAEFADIVKRSAATYLAPGHTLQITFTNIDMAGDFEPWRGAAESDVRIIKSIYPPRLDFTYTLRDAEGKVLTEGSERLTDVNFQSTLGLNPSEPFFYEKQMMRDWLRSHIRSK